MAEGTGNSEISKTPETSGSSIFPVNKESAERTLAKIAEDPTNVLFDEGIKSCSTGVSSLLEEYSWKGGLDQGKSAHVHEDLQEGGMWAHKLLRENAEALGKTLPIDWVADRKLANSLFAEAISRAKMFKGHGKEANGYYVSEMGEINAKDPEFGKAINEILKYKPHKNVFIRGVVETYSFLKKAEKVSEFNSPSPIIKSPKTTTR